MKHIRTLVTVMAALLLFAGVPLQAQYAPSGGEAVSRGIGRFVAAQYNYPSTNNYVVIGNSATGSATINVQVASIKLPDGRVIFPYNLDSPILVGGGSNQELVTPTAVSSCYFYGTGTLGVCSITASFANTHGFGEQVQSGSGGLAEAAYDAFLAGGGIVVIDGQWAAGVNITCTGCPASAAVAITNQLVFPNVGLEDMRSGVPVYYSPLSTQAVASYLAAPTTLTSGTVSSSTTVAGSASYAGGTIHVCIAYVDIMGNEGPCSADYSFTDTSAKAIQFSAPAASAGAVGWIPYIGLESGASGNEYNTLLVTQPAAIGLYPASAGVCTLTTLETVTPACAVVNATYGQATSGTVNVAAYPVVTSQQAFQLGGVSTTSYYVPNTNAHTTYSYAPGAHVGEPQIISNSQPFTASAALASTVPFVLGSIQLPPNFMNAQGKAIKICGQIVDAAGGANTITAIQFRWDADGSNATTGIPVLIGGPKMTATITSAASVYSFCQTIETVVASATATGGSLRATDGFLGVAGSSAGANPFFGVNTAVATVASLNLAEQARIDLVYVETTATTDTPQLTNLTVQVLN